MKEYKLTTRPDTFISLHKHHKLLGYISYISMPVNTYINDNRPLFTDSSLTMLRVRQSCGCMSDFEMALRLEMSLKAVGSKKVLSKERRLLFDTYIMVMSAWTANFILYDWKVSKEYKESLTKIRSKLGNISEATISIQKSITSELATLEEYILEQTDAKMWYAIHTIIMIRSSVVVGGKFYNLEYSMWNVESERFLASLFVLYNKTREKLGVKVSDHDIAIHMISGGEEKASVWFDQSDIWLT